MNKKIIFKLLLNRITNKQTLLHFTYLSNNLQYIAGFISAAFVSPEMLDIIFSLLNSNHLVTDSFTSILENNGFVNKTNYIQNLYNTILNNQLIIGDGINFTSLSHYLKDFYIDISITNILNNYIEFERLNVSSSNLDIINYINSVLPKRWFVVEVVNTNMADCMFLNRDIDNTTLFEDMLDLYKTIGVLTPVFSLCIGITKVYILLNYI